MNNKFCISKKLLPAIFILIAIVLSYPVIESTTSYKSSAASIKKSRVQIPRRVNQTSLPLTSDPKKIMEYWINTIITKKYGSNLPKMASTTRKNKIEDFITDNLYTKSGQLVALKTMINQDTFVAELDANAHYAINKGSNSIINNLICNSNETNVNDPFAYLLYHIYDPSVKGFKGHKEGDDNSLYLYKNKNGDFYAIMASWKDATNDNQNIPEVYALTYIPHETFLDSFSKILDQYGEPLTSALGGNAMYINGCSDSMYKKWKSWIMNVLEDDKMLNIPDTPFYNSFPPTPTAIPFQSRNKYQLSPEIIYFRDKFISVYYPLFPEIKIGPMIRYNSSTYKISGVFSDKMDKTKFISYKPLYNLTFYLDKCVPKKSNGEKNVSSFYTAKSIIETKINDFIYNKEKLQPISLDLNPAPVVSARSFFNYLHGYSDVTGSCTTNYYDGDILACPKLKAGIKINEDNTFALTLKPLTDNSCKIDFSGPYAVDNRHSEKPITYMIYLGK